MDADSVIGLFDSGWFGTNVNSSLSNPKTHIQNHPQNQEISLNPYVSNPLTINTTSENDKSLNSLYIDIGGSLSPKSVIFPSHLETILSSEQHIEKSRNRKRKQGRRKKNKKGKNKSLSELECEEVKGFMDLGFVFSEEDRDSNLVEIIPGLQRLGKEKYVKNIYTNDSSSIMRPYLSEAWSVLDKEEIDISLMKWRISAMSSENDIKTSLKWWAHTVASVIV